MRILRALSICIFTAIILTGCAGTSSNSEYGYETVSALEAKIACLEDVINSAESSSSDASYALSDIESEFYWVDETQAWYPEDLYELEELVNEADEAFIAIDNAKGQLDTLSTSIEDIESALSNWC